ncbi:hypothetical protein C8R44DRAFT_725751 [Mycena epipterygia]|nr:hypothetical protein C8R44DRAFT_725751 [Mycena epipterygia]
MPNNHNTSNPSYVTVPGTLLPYRYEDSVSFCFLGSAADSGMYCPTQQDVCVEVWKTWVKGGRRAPSPELDLDIFSPLLDVDWLHLAGGAPAVRYISMISSHEGEKISGGWESDGDTQTSMSACLRRSGVALVVERKYSNITPMRLGVTVIEDSTPYGTSCCCCRFPLKNSTGITATRSFPWPTCAPCIYLIHHSRIFPRLCQGQYSKHTTRQMTAPLCDGRRSCNEKNGNPDATAYCGATGPKAGLLHKAAPTAGGYSIIGRGLWERLLWVGESLYLPRPTSDLRTQDPRPGTLLGTMRPQKLPCKQRIAWQRSRRDADTSTCRRLLALREDAARKAATKAAKRRGVPQNTSVQSPSRIAAMSVPAVVLTWVSSPTGGPRDRKAFSQEVRPRARTSSDRQAGMDNPSWPSWASWRIAIARRGNFPVSGYPPAPSHSCLLGISTSLAHTNDEDIRYMSLSRPWFNASDPDPRPSQSRFTANLGARLHTSRGGGFYQGVTGSIHSTRTAILAPSSRSEPAVEIRNAFGAWLRTNRGGGFYW